jgi:hypothetical protein
MDAASYAYHKKYFEVAMENLKKESEDAWKWLNKIPVHTWARHAFDTNCKTDLVVNNLSEVFNRYILDVRKKPIRTMIEGIKNKLMTRNHEKREGAATARWEITPHYTEMLELAKKYSRTCTPRIAGPHLWQVTNGKGDQIHAVDLEARTCGCRRWDVTGLPCNHACSAIIKSKQRPEDFVSHFFKKPLYAEAFQPMIYPVPGQHDWTKTNTPDIVPPIFKINKGRKQEKRRKGKFEVPKPKDTSRMGTITCSNCELQGHRYTSCLKELRPDLKIRKNKHVVSALFLPCVHCHFLAFHIAHVTLYYFSTQTHLHHHHNLLLHLHHHLHLLLDKLLLDLHLHLHLCGKLLHSNLLLDSLLLLPQGALQVSRMMDLQQPTREAGHGGISIVVMLQEMLKKLGLLIKLAFVVMDK